MRKKMSNKEEEKKLYQNFYDIVPDPEDPKKWLVKIITGPCDGCFVRFGRLKLTPEEEQKGGSPFAFEWTFVPPFPKHLEGGELSDEESEDFEVLLSNIALELVSDWFEYDNSMQGFGIVCEQSEE